LNLKKSALPRTKKLHQRVSPECFEKHFEKRHGFIWLLKKLFGTLPPLLHKPMGFITNYWKNSSKIVLNKVLPATRCRDYALRFHWYMHICIEFSINLYGVEGKLISPSRKQHNNKESLATDLILNNHFFKPFCKGTHCKTS